MLRLERWANRAPLRGVVVLSDDGLHGWDRYVSLECFAHRIDFFLQFTGFFFLPVFIHSSYGHYIDVGGSSDGACATCLQSLQEKDLGAAERR